VDIYIGRREEGQGVKTVLLGRDRGEKYQAITTYFGGGGALLLLQYSLEGIINVKCTVCVEAILLCKDVPRFL
jgi:hypothetical protein